MVRRLQLHEELCTLLNSRNVYFRPPASEKMKYPCILYDLSKMDTEHANNKPYTIDKAYRLTVIDEDEDSEIPDKVAMLSRCKFDRAYMADGLNHWVFTLYY